MCIAALQRTQPTCDFRTGAISQPLHLIPHAVRAGVVKLVTCTNVSRFERTGVIWLSMLRW